MVAGVAVIAGSVIAGSVVVVRGRPVVVVCAVVSDVAVAEPAACGSTRADEQPAIAAATITNNTITNDGVREPGRDRRIEVRAGQGFTPEQRYAVAMLRHRRDGVATSGIVALRPFPWVSG